MFSKTTIIRISQNFVNFRQNVSKIETADFSFPLCIVDLQGLGLGGGIHIREGNITLSDLDLHLMAMGFPLGGLPQMSNASGTNGGMNMTQAEIAEVVRNQYMTNSLSNFDDVTQICLIVAFAVLILFGACGNGLVCYVVAKNPNMRTPRNIFIINLAISDLTLCCFTQPFNLMKVGPVL